MVLWVTYTFKVLCIGMQRLFKVPGTFKGKCLVGAAFFKRSLLGVHSIKFKFFKIRHLASARVLE
jgi:hypothetical protein